MVLRSYQYHYKTSELYRIVFEEVNRIIHEVEKVLTI